MPPSRPVPSFAGVPAFWPMAMAASLMEKGTELYAKNLKFAREEIRLHGNLVPKLATPHETRLDLRTMAVQEYGTPKKGTIPTLVDAPYAGHTAMIADYKKGQSLVETLLANGLPHVVLTDWKSATPDMKDLEIDNYLADLLVVIEDLGGRVNLIGLCQGGWLSAMIASRFPDKVRSLVLAGSPIDTNAGTGDLRKMVHDTPLSFYEELVTMGGGLMQGEFMLQGWKNMNPSHHYLKEPVELYDNLDDAAYLAKKEHFASWYETPVDLPGRWYLQVIEQLFKENRLAKGKFKGLGRRLDLRDITCPTYLLAGEEDDITTPEQVLDAEKYIGTPRTDIEKKIVPGGHIGLFMGSRTLKEAWPAIARWVARAAA